MIRRATAAKLRPEKKEKYIQMHKNAWPEVCKIMAKHQHSNHSVFLIEDYLFQYLEYTGKDIEMDLEKMREYPIMQQWWNLCSECVIPIDKNSGPVWQTLEEIFHNN